MLSTTFMFGQVSASPHSTVELHSNHEQHSIMNSNIEKHINCDETNPLHSLLPETVVIIDAGHGGIDGGASFENILEKDINLAVAQKLYALLQNSQVPVILNRDGDYALSEQNHWLRTSSRHIKDLSQRAGLAKQIKNKMFISLHVNSVPRKGAHGPIVLHQPNGESAALATFLQEQLDLYHNTKRNVKAVNSFYLLNYVKSPAVIVELGFISNANDREKLVNPIQQDKMAQALADGISNYLWVYQ